MSWHAVIALCSASPPQAPRPQLLGHQSAAAFRPWPTCTPFPFRTWQVKKRWDGRKLAELFAAEFRQKPLEYYVSTAKRTETAFAYVITQGLGLLEISVHCRLSGLQM